MSRLKFFDSARKKKRIGKGPDSSFSKLSVQEKIEAFFLDIFDCKKRFLSVRSERGKTTRPRA